MWLLTGKEEGFSDPRLSASCVYPERRELVLCFNEVLNGGTNLCQDTVDDVHDTVGGNLVPVHDPGAVDRDHLWAFGNSQGQGSALCTARCRASPPRCDRSHWGEHSEGLAS